MIIHVASSVVVCAVFFLPFARADVSTGVTELLKVERFIKGWRLATTQGAAH